MWSPHERQDVELLQSSQQPIRTDCSFQWPFFLEEGACAGMAGSSSSTDPAAVIMGAPNIDPPELADGLANIPRSGGSKGALTNTCRRSSAWLEQRSFKPMVQGSNPCAGTSDLYSNASFSAPDLIGYAYRI